MQHTGLGFRPQHAVDFTWRSFRIQTARDQQQLQRAQRLRHEVFCREWQGRPRQDGLDIDPLDERADHLLVTDQASGVLVATFRLLPIAAGLRPYSAGEFTLDQFLGASGRKLEMGRACIRATWRNNLTVVALYRGISAYLAVARPRWLFGCSSVLTTDAAQAALITRYLECRGLNIRGFQITADADHRLPGFQRAYLCTAAPSDEASRLVENLLPPLLRTYLRAGARLAPEPALDREFACIDYLTVLDLEALNRSFLQRFEAA